MRVDRLLLVAACLACSAASADLGTLFHSAQERARLDALRRGEKPAPIPGTVAPAVERSSAPEVTGFVKRSDGRNTVWIDGRAITATQSPKTAPLFDPRAVRDVDPPLPPDAIRLIPSKKTPAR